MAEIGIGCLCYISDDINILASLGERVERENHNGGINVSFPENTMTSN